MRRSGSKPGQPISERLLGLVAGDLPDHRFERDERGLVSFVPDDDGSVLLVSSRVEKRFLGRTEIVLFEAEYPAASLGEFKLDIRHTGRARRTGTEARVVEGGEAARRLADALGHDTKFVAAALPLDFKKFSVWGDDSMAHARIELIGASYVGIAFPPVRSYVRLYPDQREALIATFRELGRLI